MSEKMKYDFTTIMDRKGKDALAVDGIGKFANFAPEEPDQGFDVIPMWVADMNFATVPTLVSAISERLKYPHFGYYFHHYFLHCFLHFLFYFLLL